MRGRKALELSGRERNLKHLCLAHELRRNRALVEGIIAGYHRQSRGSDEVIPAVFILVIADHCTFGDLHIAIDDGPLDAAMTADIDVGKDDARVDFGE